MLKTQLDNILHLWGEVKHSPSQDLQNLGIPSTFGKGWHKVTGEGKKAFTLAEVLITLGIIGVVAAMTIPTLIADYQEKSYNTAATTFEKKLGEALQVMNSQSSLAGHNSTEDFVDELSKHFKITKTCSNDKLLDCFEKEVFWGSGEATPEAVDMTKVKKAKNLGQQDWQQTNVIGVQFASGVTALVAYNKDASQDPHSNEIVSLTGTNNDKNGSVSLGTNALAILYDTNGAKSPNKSSKDIHSVNVTKIGNSCFAEVNGVCIAMAPQRPTPVSKAECETMISTHGIQKCSYANDYWAGAVKLCGHVNKMPKMTDLGKIAAYVYNKDSIGAKNNLSNLTYDTDKAAELGLPTSGFYLWSGEESSETHTYNRSFYSNNTSWGNGTRDYRFHLALCIIE